MLFGQLHEGLCIVDLNMRSNIQVQGIPSSGVIDTGADITIRHLFVPKLL